MTTTRDFDRAAAAFLADGPIDLPERVLDAVVDEIHLTRQRRAARVSWRFRTMPSPSRLAAIVAVVAVIAIGALAMGVGRSSPAPSEAPSAAPSVPPAASEPAVLSAPGVPVLDAPFISNRNGYQMQIPSSARVTQATSSWAPGASAPLWGSTALDEVIVGDVRFVATQQPLVDQTPETWLRAYCTANGGSDCGSVPGSWEEIKIANQTAYVDTDGIDAAAGTIAPNGKLYEALLATPDRAWVFTMDGALDRSHFDAYLRTIVLMPDQAVDTPALTSTFTSPTYGYSVGTLPAWTTTNATEAWTGYDNQDPVMDLVTITGTDSRFAGASQALGGQSYDDFLAAFHANTKSGVPGGCDGGEPSTWPELPVGDQVGRLEVLCNAAEALVHVGDRVYVFDWGNDTFDTSQHFPLAAWKELLRSVAFAPENAK